MSTVSFGEKSWEEESASGNGKSDFFNMKDDGQYHLRIVGKPHEFAAHWVESGTVKRKVNCAGKDCVLCAKKIKASIRYFIPVILRKGPGITEGANTIAVTEFGPQVYGHVRSLYQTPDWGNPTNYDIMVDKNYKGRGPSGTYLVIPTKTIPLSDEEKAGAAEFIERLKLKELSAPLTNELIIDKLGPDISAALGLSLDSSNSNPAAEFDYEKETSSAYDFSS